MTLRKITNDNSVRYISATEQIKKNNKPKTIKAASVPRKKNKNFSQNSKKFVNDFAASGFGVLTN